MAIDCRADIFPAEDMPGVIIAHCHRFDIVTQGDSNEDARAQVIEAAGLVVEWDTEEGLDPAERRYPADYLHETRSDD